MLSPARRTRLNRNRADRTARQFGWIDGQRSPNRGRDFTVLISAMFRHTWASCELYLALTATDLNPCPNCTIGRMVLVEVLKPCRYPSLPQVEDTS